MATQSSAHIWFGPYFQSLAPALQKLHQQGGVLSGEVDIQFGRGFAGWLGKRFAKKMGIPLVTGKIPFRVQIQHTSSAMIWSRSFAGQVLESVFTPIGHYPGGYWLEQSGAVQLFLAVDIQHQGWDWLLKRAAIRGVPCPLWILPRLQAYKRVEQGGYRFQVSFSYPVFGHLLSYGGLLTAN